MNDVSSSQARLKELKAALRLQVRARRDALDAHTHARVSNTIIDKLLSHEKWHLARSVLAYSSIGSELQTAPLLEATLAQGKALVLPRINKAQRRLDLFQVNALQRDTEAGVWGILEPRVQCPAVAAENVDLVIVPGLAFDLAGGRMGYGGGYYDELLPRLNQHCWRVALAFAAQIVAEVPREAHDECVDLLITEAGEYAIRTPPALER